MKVLIAPGPYKECLESNEVADAIYEGINSVLPHLEMKKFPMCDGGTGFCKQLVHYTNGKIHKCKVLGPLGYEIDSSYGVISGSDTAVIESAAACGLSLVPHERRNPLATTSYGLGQLVLEAKKKGCKRVLIGCGDSSTNDGGVGAMQALGTRFYDDNGRDISFGGGQLSRIASIDNRESQCYDMDIIVACNLTSVLTGSESTSLIYSPQKGASPQDVTMLDNGVNHFVQKVYEFTGEDIGAIPGAGGSGGLSGGLYAFGGAKLRYSMEVVSDITGLEKMIEDSDIIITGEGKVDNRTATGKIACGIALYGKKLNIPTIAIAGQIADNADDVYYNGIDYVESITRRPMTEEESIKNADRYVREAGARIGRLIKLCELNKMKVEEDENVQKLDTIIFDLGKTLVYTAHGNNLEDKLAEAYNFKDSSDARKLIYSICNGSYNGLSHEGFIGKLAEQMKERFENVDEQVIRKACELKIESSELSPEAIDTLKSFRGKGYSLALVSNATPLSRGIVKNTGIEEYFDTMIFSCDVGYLKPDPRIFQCAIKNLGKKPSQVCVVGDKIRTDILGAKIIGTKTVLLEKKNRSVIENDSRIPTDAIIPSLGNLNDLDMFE